MQLSLVPLCLGTRLSCNYIKMLSCLLSSEDKPRLTLVPRRTENETMLLVRGASAFAGLQDILAEDIELQTDLKGPSMLHEICMSMHVSVR